MNSQRQLVHKLNRAFKYHGIQLTDLLPMKPLLRKQLFSVQQLSSPISPLFPLQLLIPLQDELPITPVDCMHAKSVTQELLPTLPAD